MKAIINPIVVARDTEKEAIAHAWCGRGDPRHRQGRNLGGNIEIIGSPEQVVEQLAGLKKAGIDGVQLNFYDFRGDLAYFADCILPLLKEAGLRF